MESGRQADQWSGGLELVPLATLLLYHYLMHVLRVLLGLVSHLPGRVFELAEPLPTLNSSLQKKKKPHMSEDK